MKRSLVTTALLLGLVFPSLACRPSSHTAESEVKVAGNQVGGLKGANAISQILASRMMGDRFDLMESVYVNTNIKRVSGLLGGHDGVGIKNRFANGTPNAVNMLLWSTVLTNFASQVANTVCQNIDYESINFALNPTAKSILKDCGDNAATNSWASSPRELWDLLLQVDAPEIEFQAWEAWIKSEAFEDSYTSPRERLAAAMSAALMNPYFLLER